MYWLAKRTSLSSVIAPSATEHIAVRTDEGPLVQKSMTALNAHRSATRYLDQDFGLALKWWLAFFGGFGAGAFVFRLVWIKALRKGVAHAEEVSRDQFVRGARLASPEVLTGVIDRGISLQEAELRGFDLARLESSDFQPQVIIDELDNEAAAKRSPRFKRDGKTFDLVSKRASASPFSLGRVPLTWESLALGIALIGAMGKGKTTEILELLNAAESENEKCFVYDPGKEFTRFYFKAGHHLLNPFDTRCINWSILYEIRAAHEYMQFAAFQFPDIPGDKNPFFQRAAREVFADILKMVNSGELGPRSMRNVFDIATRTTDVELHHLLKHYGLASAQYITPNGKGATGDIRKTIKGGIDVYQYVTFDASKPVFSVRDWAADRDDRSWLFLPAGANEKQIMANLFSSVIEIMLLGARDKEPINQSSHKLTSLLVVIDEFAELPKCEAIVAACTQGRKYGFSLVLGFQNVSLAKKTYGPEDSETIISNLQTKYLMQVGSEESAKVFSGALMAAEKMVVGDGTSHGLEDDRDGANLSRSRQEVALVLPSEIMSLGNLEGYLKIAGKYPVVKTLTAPHKDRPEIAPRELVRQELAVDSAQGDSGAKAPDIAPEAIRKIHAVFVEFGLVDGPPHVSKTDEDGEIESPCSSGKPPKNSSITSDILDDF